MISKKQILFVILVLLVFQASSQVATKYVFTQTAGVYTSISGGTVIASSTLNNMDDAVFGPVPILPFTFDGVTNTYLYISTNGHITFGKKPMQSNYLALSGTETYSGAIAAFSQDLDKASSGTSSIRYQQVGNEFIIQWQNVARYQVFGEHISFQIRLNTSNSQINIVFGETIIPGSSSAFPQLGLRGPDNTFSTNINNRSVQPTTGSWLNSVAGTNNTSSCYFNFTAPATIPALGNTFTWTPPAVDLQATQLISPESGGCYGTHESVFITLRNSGNSAIDFSASPATVTGTVTGPNPVTFSSALINTGILPAGATLNVLLSSAYDMSLTGTYMFNASVSIAGDAYTTNNAIQPVSYSSHTPAVNASADVSICAGQSTNLNVSANANSFILTQSNSSILVIPDNNPSGVSSTITIAGAAVAASLVSVRIDHLDHTFDSDLIFTLTAPNGSSVLLCNQEGGGDENFINTLFTASASTPISNGAGPFTGSFLPENPFTSLTGLANGTWSLTITDNAPSDEGALFGWTLFLPVANGIASYQWNPSGGLSLATISNPVATPGATTTYGITVTDSSACANSDSVLVTVNSFPVVNTLSFTQPDCSVSSGTIEVQASGTGVLEYNLNSGPFQTSSTFSGLLPGNYNLHIRSQNNTSCETNYAANPVVINPGDAENPHISCPNDVVISNNHNQCGAVFNFLEPAALDNCPGVVVTCVPASGSFFPVGTTTVTCTARDHATNTASCSFHVTVNDVENPVIHCPADVVADADLLQPFAGTVSIGTATATDNCGIQNIAGERSDHLALTDHYPTGATSITWKATDINGLTSTCSQTITVRKPPSTLTYTGDTAVQYSDKMIVRATLTDQQTHFPLAGRTITFTIFGQPVSAVTDVSGIATAELMARQNPGSFVVTTVFADDNTNTGSTDSDVFKIKQEDADVAYTGQEFISATCSNCNTAAVLLRASIKDISAVALSGDLYPGDIRKARVRFVNADNNTPISSWLLVSLVNAQDTTLGTVSYSWPVSIPPAGYIDPYSVRVEVDNGNYLASTEVVINVSRGSLTEFVSGGGHINPVNSSGQFASDSLKNLNFGFNVKYNHSGQNLQGTINVTFRRTQSGVMHLYRIKGNSMNFLSVNVDGSVKKAFFTGRVSLKDVTSPSTNLSLGSNLIVQVTVTDCGPGNNDSIGFTLWSNSNALLYSSNWVNSTTQEKNLSGGNIEVHLGNTVLRTDAAATLITKEESLFNVRVMPNPSSNQFTLITEGNGKELIQLRVMNMLGELIETQNDLAPGEAIELGNNYKAGIYFVQVEQGGMLRTVKILKQQ